MLSLKSIKLKHQVFLLIFIAILVVSLVQGIYYIRFYNIIQSRSTEYTRNMMFRIETEISKEAEVMEKLALSVSYNKLTQEYLSTEEKYRQFDLNKNLKELLTFSKTNLGGIEDIILYDRDNNFTYTDFENASFYSYFINGLAIKYSVSRQIPKKINEAQPVFTSILRDKYGNFSYYAYVYPVFCTKINSPDFYKYIGSCIILCRLDTVKDAIENAGLTQNSVYLIIDSEDNMVSSRETNDENDKFLQLINASGKAGEATVSENIGKVFSKSDYIIDQREVGKSNWNIFCIIPVKELVSDLEMVRTSGIWLEIVMVFFLFLFGFLLNRNISTPIFKLMSFMELIGKGQSKKRIVIPEKNEIGKLSMYINQMLDQIDQSTEQVINTQKSLYQAEIVKRKSQLSALQSQINPHFLYNTLDCIKSIALVKESQEIVQIASSMSVIFRYAIREDEFVRVFDEIECVKRYFNIMNIRYRGKFHMEIAVDESLHDCMTLKMLLQPIVENAIYHGLETKRDQGLLKINGSIVSDTAMRFEIIDTGRGIPFQELRELKARLDSSTDIAIQSTDASRGIGLTNINSRIKIEFGAEYGIDVDSVEHEGTRVTMVLPIVR